MNYINKETKQESVLIARDSMGRSIPDQCNDINATGYPPDFPFAKKPSSADIRLQNIEYRKKLALRGRKKSARFSNSF